VVDHFTRNPEVVGLSPANGGKDILLEEGLSSHHYYSLTFVRKPQEHAQEKHHKRAVH